MVIDSYGKENVIGYSINVNEICDALRNLVSFAQFKKREKHRWRSVTLLKVTLLHGCF